jgi:hypothetical protein
MSMTFCGAGGGADDGSAAAGGADVIGAATTGADTGGGAGRPLALFGSPEAALPSASFRATRSASDS